LIATSQSACRRSLAWPDRPIFQVEQHHYPECKFTLGTRRLTTSGSVRSRADGCIIFNHDRKAHTLLPGGASDKTARYGTLLLARGEVRLGTSCTTLSTAHFQRVRAQPPTDKRTEALPAPIRVSDLENHIRHGLLVGIERGASGTRKILKPATSGNPSAAAGDAKGLRQNKRFIMEVVSHPSERRRARWYWYNSSLRGSCRS
jgi:hypothetical protein